MIISHNITKDDLVSVIITTYGHPYYLKDAIQSVINQTYRNIELIIVDDNNPDTAERKITEDIVQNLKTSIPVNYYKHSHNLNGAAARNTGLRHARGNYVAFLDSDDFYATERIEKCINTMKKAKDNVAGVYSGCEFRKNGITYFVERNIKSGNFLKETLACKFNFCSGSNLFIKKSVADQFKGFDESFTRHQDYEFLVRLFQHYSLLGIKDVLIIKNNDNRNLPDVNIMIKIKEHYLRKYKDIIDHLSEEEQKVIYYNNYIQISELALKNYKFKLSEDYFQKANNLLLVDPKDRIRHIILKNIMLFKYFFDNLLSQNK